MKVFRRYKFYYPVEISVVETGPLTGFPWLKPSSFMQKMAEYNDLSHLLGGHSLVDAEHMLLDFWTKYKSIAPRHGLWQEADRGAKPLKRCIPLFFHGDEGVTYKKGGVLVLSFQGVIGHGSRQRGRNIREERFRAASEGIPLNFIKTGMQTRMLILVCPKDCNGSIEAEKTKLFIWNIKRYIDQCSCTTILV